MLHTFSVEQALAALPGFPSLRGRRVGLRAPMRTDTDALFALFADPEVTRFWSRPAMTHPTEAEGLLAEIENAFAERTMLHWVLIERGVVVGTCALFRFDSARRRAELGYALRRDRWGRGLATDGVATALHWGVRVLGLQRIEADVDPRNARSSRLLHGLGFRSEGVMRGRIGLGDTAREAEVFSLDAAAWPASGGAPQPRA